MAATLRIYFEQELRGRGWVYRVEHADGRDESGPLTSLEVRESVLKRWGEHLLGLPWVELPTFGGVRPRATQRVWSWDEARLLVGESACEVALVRREDVTDARGR
ncbi:hypothetical protein [Chondromyces crocatus]|uniref:Uncharacterized protein n=1 Tax=Chondromyces crocatus TaxID=52 RepID=A0A0K1EAC4_CHOCO|nr:hypothetical protein [Chondromyces crocatus]AKT37804.1 uncharacterized protein CMC5_019470 [Chondromyces crocatus]